VFSAVGHIVTRNPVALKVRDGVLRLLAAPDHAGEGAGTQLLVYRDTAERTALSRHRNPSTGHGDRPNRAP
jgi:hypothetical protein